MIRLLIVTLVLAGSLGCASLQPFLLTTCSLLGVGIHVGPATADFDLCDIPGIGPETPAP